MKKFLWNICQMFIIPIGLLMGIYIWTDPFKTLRPFSLSYFDTTNRDNLSSELFLHNIDSCKYDSYIFGSSRACGINSYQWVKYLPKGSKQFVFQAWSETITGIYQKIRYIDGNGYPLRNAIVLLDIPGSFATIQEPTSVLSIKHHKFANKPWLYNQIFFFSAYCSKPSEVINSVRECIQHPDLYPDFDTVTNDWYIDNKFNTDICPPKDSLSATSEQGLKQFFKTINSIEKNDTSIAVIDKNMVAILTKIKNIFARQHTDYRIIVSPGFYLISPQIHPTDLHTLKELFGKDNVFNYSGENYLTTDYNNFSDPNHFGLHVGWHIIEDIYNAHD